MPAIAAGALALAGACAMPEETLGTTQQEAMAVNGLSVNGLAVNGLAVNGLAVNGLVVNGLSVNGLAVNGLAVNALRADPSARDFLRYVYSCAMPAGQSEVLELTDENGNYIDTVLLEGGLGLAPEWADGSCNLKCQMWVSACLLARTNAYGVQVEISLRGDGLPAGAEEVLEFPLREGTYYGNIFKTSNDPVEGLVSDPHLYACSGPDSNKGMVTARFCSGADTASGCLIDVAGPCTCPDGTLDCDVQREGKCESYRESDGTPYGCWTPIEDNADVRKYNEALTVYLREPLPHCGDLKCDPDETPSSCPYDCFNHAWAFLPGLISTDSTIELTSTPDGNVIVAGTFWNALDFGPAGILSADLSHQTTPGWDSPGFLAKIDPDNGTPLWATALGTEISSVATDADGNVFVAGASGTDYGDVTAWITKLPPSGDPSGTIWSVELPGAVPPIGLGVDLDGNVVVGGSYYEKLYFDSEHQPRLEAGRRAWGVFLSKLSGADATPVWMETIAAPLGGPHDRWSALAVGPGADDIYLTGAPGSWCGDQSCLEKYAGDGTLIWSVPLAFSEATGTIYGNPRDAAVAEDGTVYVTGRLLAPSGEPRDVFIARYSGASAPAPAAPLWWSHIADSGFDPGDTLAEGTELVLTDSGEAVLAGSFPKSPDVGATGYYDGGLGDVDDIYTAGFGTEAGDRQWIRHAGGAYQDYVEALAVAPGGRIVIAGRFVGSMLFEGTLLEIPAELATANPDSWGLFIGSYLGQPDTAAPTLSLPDGLTAEAQGPDGAEVSYQATATDLLDGAVEVSCDPASGSLFGLGGTQVACSAQDSDLNLATGEFTVTVVDTTAPALSVPGGVYVEAGGATGAVASYVATATDLVDGAVTPSCAPASGSLFGLGQTTVSCTAADAAGNAATATFPVEVGDLTAPVLSLPEVVTAEAENADGATVSFAAEVSASDAVDGAVAVSCTPASGEVFALGTTTVSCTATDSHGNSASDSFPVEVVDSTAPELALPADMVVEAEDATGAVVTYTASASDAVDGTVAVDCVPASGSLFAPGFTEVACSAADSEGNTATGSFTVEVVDTIAPTLTLPADMVVEAESSDGAVVTFATSASDAVDGAVDVDCVPASGATFALGDTLVTCTAADLAGNTAEGSFTVSVVDTTAPELTLPAVIEVEATGPGGATALYVVSATDLVAGDVDVSCTPASGAQFALGNTTVQCTASDFSGNTAEGSFTVSVVDTTAPTLALPEDITAEAESAGGAVVGFSASSQDLVDGDVIVECVPASGSLFGLGVNTVTCTAADSTGNTAEGSFTVTVVDTTAPVLTVPADITAEAEGAEGAAVGFSVSAVDLVDAAPAVSCTPASGSTFALGSTQVTCTATDADGNSASKSFAVTVVDTTPPELVVPAAQILEAQAPAGAIAEFTAAATDLVDGAVAPTCTPASGSVFALGINTVTCTAADSMGNTASGSFTITVVDTTPPVVSAPADITVEAEGADGTAVPFTATASDLVDGPVTATCTPAGGSLFGVGATTVTCTAADARGNSASASFVVSVVDTTAPELALPADITVEAEGADGTAVTYAATATDVVDGDLAVTCTPASGSVFAVGVTPVTCTAADAAGNPASGSFLVTVQDTTAPVITVPASAVEADYAGAGGTAVTYATSATDLVDGDVAVTCTPASGSLFDVGVTPVTCTASDAAGNTATASFDVEVHYTWSGFEAPLDNWDKVFKLGSNVSVKFTLTEAGAPVTDLYATLWVAEVVGGEVTGEWAPASSASSVEGNEFRYSPTTQQYIFDLNTGNMSKGTWQLRAELYDGADRITEIKLK